MLESLAWLDRVEKRIDRFLPEEPREQPAKAGRASTERPSLLDYFVETSPELSRPYWLGPYADVLERAIGGNLRVAVAAPPQHGKTELTLRGLLYWAKFWPGYRHAYVTYNIQRAQWVAKEFKQLALEAGFEVSGTLDQIVLDGTSSIRFGSGRLTGYPIDGVCVIDDPIADRVEAFSKTIREKWIGWWRSTARVRRHPGTSFIVMATRWHVDDPSGYLVANEAFDYINLKAIAEPTDNDDVDVEGHIVHGDPLHRCPGAALWPERKPLELLAEDQRDRYTFASMFQGEPVPLGAGMFRRPGEFGADGAPVGPGFYRELPKDGYRGAFGLDLAGTHKTRADWSVLIEGWVASVHDADGKTREKLFIVDVIRRQAEVTEFKEIVRARQTLRPGWPIRWYVGGQEPSINRFLKAEGIRVKAIPAVAEKKVRALPVAERWNSGDVLLPDPEFIRASWVHDFLDVVCNFVGEPNGDDDEVDALAALHDQLMRMNPMARALLKVAAQ